MDPPQKKSLLTELNNSTPNVTCSANVSSTQYWQYKTNHNPEMLRRQQETEDRFKEFVKNRNKII